MMQTATQNTGFKDLVAANRKAGRLDEPTAPDTGPKMQLASMRLMPEEIAQAKRLADADERSVAWFCRRMYLRGLASYVAEQGTATAAQ